MIRILLLGLLLISPAVGQAQGDEPAAYRMEEYLAPVPSTLTGATVISPETAYALWKTGRVAFLDVLPRPPKPANLPAGTIWHEKARNSIPGAMWLPNVGYGELAEVMHAYFKAGLARATGDDKDAPVVFFCRTDCWMSWNAAKRALEYGYTRVFWYPEGTEGWVALNYPTKALEPVPGGQ